MADLFVQLSIQTSSNPKILGAHPAAKWLWVTGLLVAFRERSDGHLRPTVACAEAEVAPSHVRTLVTRGLWHRPGHDCGRCPEPAAGQVVIHDYLEHQRSKAELDESREKKRAAGKKGASSRWGGSSHGSRHSKSHGTSGGTAMAEEDVDVDAAAAAGHDAAAAAKLPPPIVILRDRLQAVTALQSLRFDALTPAQTGRLLALIDIHGDARLVELALRNLRTPPPVMVQAFLKSWESAPPPGKVLHQVKPEMCSVHGHEHYPARGCPGCATEARAIDRDGATS